MNNLPTWMILDLAEVRDDPYYKNVEWKEPDPPRDDSNLPTIYLGCPIQNRAWMLTTWLHHLEQLDYPKDKIHVSWLVNYPKDHPEFKPDPTLQMLKAWRDQHEEEYRKVTIKLAHTNWVDGRRFGRWFTFFAALRNVWLSFRGDEDFIYSVDSDILMPRDSLRRLVERDKDVCSIMIKNGPIAHPGPEGGGMAWNFMIKMKREEKEPKNKYDHFNYIHMQPRWLQLQEIRHYQKEWMPKAEWKREPPFIYPMQYSDLPPVDMTGAIYLIRREVLDSGVEYGFHHQGEDCYFSAMAQEKGYTLHCDYFQEAVHLLNPAMHQEYLAMKANRQIIPAIPRPIDEPPWDPIIELEGTE